MMIKKYYEFIFEDVNRSKSIVKTKLEEYEKLKKFLTSKNSAGYMGTMTDFLFNGVPYNELINLYQKIIDLKQKNIKFNLDEYKKYEDVLDSIAKKQISYKFKNIINKFPKEQKDLLGYPKELSPENILMISKLYDVDSSAFISKISRYKDEYDLIESIERFLSGKIKSFDRESIKSMLDKDLKLVFENDNIIILRTYTHESIVKVGSDTSWCIVSSKSTFESYTKKGQTQYVLIDYTKDTFDIDFKIGFTLSTNNDILYAHNVLDRSVKQLVNEILNSNKVDLEQINVTQKVDLSTITEKSKISDIENIILSGVLKQEGTDVYLLKILVNKLQRLRNGSDVLGLIKTLFKSIISLKKSDVIFDEDFDKYKTLLGNYYGTIKKMLVNNIILVSKTMVPENIFRDDEKLAKYYKYWMSDLNEISPNYYINEVERDPDLVDAILYFSSKSKQTKSIKLITLYCKMTKGENINMDEVKNLIDSSKLYKYQYYNYFGIKYHFDPKRSHSLELFESNPELANSVYEALGFKNQKNTVRLYRIENKNIPYDESREGIVSKKEIVGGFFTDNIDTVANYIRKNQSQEGINLVYVDISKDDLDKYHVSKNEYAKTMDVESDNWIIPSDINRNYVDLSSVSKVTGNFMTLSKAKQEVKFIIDNLPAPKIKSPSKKKPNYMKEYDQKTEKYSPMAPMSKKRLSK